MSREIVSLSEYKQELNYFNGMELINSKRLYNKSTQECFDEVNGFWILNGPLNEDTQLCNEFSQKLNKIVEEIKIRQKNKNYP